jgi:tetratricopeptide (TPR) repeat protein/tRNA A-37 threonylcarbamoyl transferase component Bud32
MSETKSLNTSDQATSEARPQDAGTMPAPDAAGHALFERLGVGGMGEVYRCGDDALRRDLAIKVIRAELRGNSVAEERFLREARLTGSLQHPGVVPVHHLGRLADGRPCYTMKLVRGRTLDDLLRDEPDGPERLPRLLAVMEKVCQAVAYAHSRGVLHRDLKPTNVMVGEFGEVQVMDWGLAKQLHAGAAAAESTDGPTEAVETVAWAEEAAGLSRAGAALGTPAYMPPEQAAGDWDIVDERADVFALGAMLYEILTGHPPYPGANPDEMLRRARRGDLAGALGRLERCGADTVLVNLCRDCLASEREGRPRHAGVVAERLASYQADVQERLRQAELGRARAEVQALEQRKRRRLRAALALAGLLLLSGGGLVWWRQATADRAAAVRQAEADQAAAQVMGEARSLGEQARAEPLNAAGYDKAVLAAARAGDVARAGGASEAVQRQSEELLGELQAEAEAATKDRRLLARLLEARGPREGPKYSRDDQGTMMALAEPTVEEQFASAFRDWGLDVDAVAETAARLKARPAVVVTEVIAALDEWASQRRVDKKPEAARRVAELAAALDAEPGSLRRELREILERDRLLVERALGVLSAALRPVPVPAIVPWGRDRTRLRQLADRMDPAAEPMLGLLTLARALGVAGEEELAERLLRDAVQAHRREVVLYHTLGQLLILQEPPRWADAVGFYRAANALRPDLGVNLAMALLNSGEQREGLGLLARLVKESPNNPYLHFQQANSLYEKHDLDGAIACYQKALALDPKFAPAHYNLGNALYAKDDRDGAIARYQTALDLNPKYALAHINLGNALRGKGDLDGAIARYKKALDLNPNEAQAHTNLGAALYDKGDRDGAIACYKKALALDPKFAPAHYNLGNLLRDKGDLEGAIVCFQKTLQLYPKYGPAHYNLGNLLRDKGDLDGAIARYRKALDLNSKYAEAHCNLADVLLAQGRFAEAVASVRRGHELGSKRPGWRYPSAQWVRDAERLLMLDKKLSAILTGEATPANPGEAITLALMCQQHKKRHVAAARLFADAFATQPELAADLNHQHRYNAACSAALAAATEGEDARLLPDKVVTMFRHWALGWLRDDLTAYAKLARRNDPTVQQAIQKSLAHWRRDSDLASVRDPQALDRLPENERPAWQKLWRDVDELAK